MLAQIYHQITPTPTPVLARALLTHHSRDPRTSQRVPDGDENYLGFGLPAAPPYCLECTPHMATLVFDDTLRSGHYLEWDQFPYPHSFVFILQWFVEVVVGHQRFQRKKGSKVFSVNRQGESQAIFQR